MVSLSWFHEGMECTHHGLHHLHSLCPEFGDDGRNIHLALVLGLLKSNVNGDECTSPPHTRTVGEEGGIGERKGREGRGEGGRGEGMEKKEKEREGGIVTLLCSVYCSEMSISRTTFSAST